MLVDRHPYRSASSPFPHAGSESTSAANGEYPYWYFALIWDMGAESLRYRCARPNRERTTAAQNAVTTREVEILRGNDRLEIRQYVDALRVGL
jgi:dipeptidase